MLFARRGKQGRREENSEDALANERTHNALAQLSVSRRACKAKPQWYGATQFTRRVRAGRAGSFDQNYDHEHEQEQESAVE
jgi:hypothetical protein